MIIFIAVIFTVQVFSQENPALRFKNQPLRSVLNEIKSGTGINFIYNDDLIERINVTFNFEGDSPVTAVKHLLEKYGIACRIFDENSFVLFKMEKEKETENIYRATVIEHTVPDASPAVLFSKPEMISKADPVYPIEAVKKNIEGNVSLKLFITAEGNVGKTLLLNSSGSSILDSAAVRYTAKLKFLPAEENGKPKNVWISMIFRYQISGKNNVGLKK